jgi:hypothetical protein
VTSIGWAIDRSGRRREINRTVGEFGADGDFRREQVRINDKDLMSSGTIVFP